LKACIGVVLWAWPLGYRKRLEKGGTGVKWSVFKTARHGFLADHSRKKFWVAESKTRKRKTFSEVKRKGRGPTFRSVREGREGTKKESTGGLWAQVWEEKKELRSYTVWSGELTEKDGGGRKKKMTLQSHGYAAASH